MRHACLAVALAAACAADDDRPATIVADVDIIVARPPGIGCLEIAAEDQHAFTWSFRLALPGPTRLTLPAGAYSVTARAFADCAAPPDDAPWITPSPRTLILTGPGTHTLTLELRRPTRLHNVTTLEIPWSGSFLANAWGDFLGDGSTTILFGGPSWRNERTPFRAVRVGQGGAISDVSATLIPDEPAAVHARRALALDLNGDGRLDFFSANHGWDFPPYPGETQTLLLSQPDGTLADASLTLPQIPVFAHSAAAGDVRAVGRADLFVGDLSPHGSFFLRNDGGGALRYDDLSLPPDLGIFTACRFVDVDGDGALDLVVVTLENGDVAGASYRSDGSGSFAAAARRPFPPGSFGPQNTISVDVIARDLDHDGDQDLLLSQTAAEPFYSGRRIQVLINDGAGDFTDETEARIPGQSGAGKWAQFLFLADLDFDGDDDLLLQVDHPRDDDVLAYVDDGTGHFAPAPPDLLPAGARRSLVPVDLNHDGRTDLVSFAPDGARLIVTAYRR